MCHKGSHNFSSCKYATTPKTNTEFWVEKIAKNRERDKTHTEQLVALGWNVLTVWECDIRHNYKHDLPKLVDTVEAEILRGKSGKISMKIYEDGKARSCWWQKISLNTTGARQIRKPEEIIEIPV